ncbi:hypothetical protein TNCV_5009091 [Trichonephila clavipes]|nr:hypothetical protein TNCV_5009091 [Trichonephila clavipes]
MQTLLQLTPNHILNAQPSTKLLKMGMVPLRDSLWELLYSPDAPRIAEAIKTFEIYDEAHFWLNGYVNKQNCRIWSEANPQVYVETPLHPEKLTGALYGLVESFFKNDEGHKVTVNGDRYKAMITNFSFLN